MSHQTVSRIMRDFADRTGLTSDDGSPTRYLWTDAFAVCNFLGLFLEHGDAEALALARRLVDQTHQTLGKHRHDDSRSGWISGLDEQEGARHPTLGGLRIGKRLPERGSDQPMDTELEWERDGQYFHYLTKWMHALQRTAEVTEDPTYHRWAIELARTAHARFTAPGQRLHWKMSIDLSRPQVPSMGQHDPLDAFVTYQQLQASRDTSAELDLRAEIRAMAQLCEACSWDTADVLGIGGLLCDAWRLAPLVPSAGAATVVLLPELLRAAARGLAGLRHQGVFDRPVEYRLAFRELGLSIGLHAATALRGFADSNASALPREVHDALGHLSGYDPLAAAIEQFWSAPASQASVSWQDHRDINAVMYATSLAPLGYLGRAS